MRYSKNIKNLVVFSLFLLILVIGTSSHSKAESSWLSTGEPTFKDYGLIPQANNSNGSLLLYNECFNTKFAIAEANGVVTNDVCAYKVPGGLIGNNKYFKLDGTKYAGLLRTSQSTNSFLSALPSGMLLEFTWHKNGNNLEIHRKFGGFNNIDSVGDYGSAGFTYTLDSSDFTVLNGPDGKVVTFTPRGVSYSVSGRYIVVDSPSHGYIKIDLINGDVKRFSDSLRFWDSTIQSAVSEDGRYVATASYKSGYIRIFDLNNCTTFGCKYKDLHTLINTKLLNYIYGARNLSFNGSTLYFEGATRTDGVVNYGKYALAPPGTDIDESKIDYLSLGDSFASGEGAYNYLPYTDTVNNRCHVSVNSYPFIAANSLPSINSYKSIACSGAKIRDITTLDGGRYSEDPQAKNKEDSSYDDEIYANFLPGYRAQLGHVINNRPKVLTISTVGNDIGFGDIIKKCVLSPNTCYEENSYERYALASIINNKYEEMVAMFGSIKNNLPIDGKAYVIGYPQVIDPYGNCAANVLMNQNEGVFSHKLISLLNSRVEMATKQAGIFYVSTENVFDGYKLCEIQSHLSAMNGLGNNVYWSDIEVFGKVVRGPKFETESYHPNKLGHELFAKTILGQTEGFTKEMPVPVISDPWLKDELWIDFVGDTVWPEKALIHYNPDVSADVIYKNAGLEYDVDGQQFSLKPNSEFSFAFYSDPVDAGAATSDANGNLAGTLPIPAVLPPGYHTLSIKGKNIVNEDIDIQKIVYVASSPEDIDGDGTPNTEEICLLVEPAGIDADKDGIDDACDGFIDQPPADVPDDVGVVDNPDITNTNKDLTVSEARPQWLLDLEAEIQARNLALAQHQDTDNTPSAAQSSPPSSTTNTSPTNNSQNTSLQDNQNQPQTSSATEVRGIEDTAAKEPETTATTSAVNKWIIALPIVILFALIIVYLQKTGAKQKID